MKDADELYEQLIKNTIMYGTGFMKMQMDPKEGLKLSIVPIEDYRYLNVEIKDEDRRLEGD